MSLADKLVELEEELKQEKGLKYNWESIEGK
jgi:hypothetical protein